MLRSCLLVGLLVLLHASVGFADDWTAVGCSGTQLGGPGDTRRSSSSCPSEFFTSSSPLVTGAGLAYNVTNTFGTSHSPPWNRLQISYMDNTTQGFVTAALLRSRLDGTGNSAQLCMVTSVTGTTSASCSFTEAIDFSTYAYWVNVTLQASGSGAFVGIRTLRID